MKKVVISCGGTGGHLYVALAIGQLLQGQAEVSYLTTSDRMDREVLAKKGLPFLAVPVRGFSGGIIKKLQAIWLLRKGKRRIKKYLKAQKIDLGISCGGYLGLALVLAGKKKVVVHEANKVPGLANKISARLAKANLTTFPDTKLKHSRCAGHPRWLAVISQPKVRPPYLTSRKIVTIVAGSLGAAKLNQLGAYLAGQEKDYQLVLVTGQRYYQEYCHLNCTVVPYEEDLPSLLSYSDLVITRAGAGVVCEVLALKKKAIIIPSPNVTNNHQLGNALAVASRDRIVIEEANLDFAQVELTIKELLTPPFFATDTVDLGSQFFTVLKEYL